MDNVAPPSKAPGTVAVIIPFYNGSRYIERAIVSVLSQTVPADDFLIVDDGSEAAESARLHEIATRHGVRVVRQENGGQGAARNFGVSQTVSTYLCFLDQDDFFLRTHIETLLDHVPRNDPHFGWVYGDLMEADAEGHIFETSIAIRYSDHPKTSVREMIAGDMHVLPSASLIAREAFDHVGGFDPQFMGYEDDDLFLRLFRAGYSNSFLPEPVTVWCINKDSTSHSIRMSRSRLLFIRKLCSLFGSDPERLKLYMRELIFPRFCNLIVWEAVKSIYFARDAHEIRMARHRDEFVAMLDEFATLMKTHTRLKIEDRFRLRLYQACVRPKSRAVLFLPYTVMRVVKRFGKGRR